MTFSRKIFIAVFCSTLLIGSTLIWVGHGFVRSKSEKDFISRYSVFTKILADALGRLDTNTEIQMLNAAKVVSGRDHERGVLSNSELKSLREELGVFHIFVTNRQGTFIRSTNDDTERIPNLFSFCEDYRKLISGSLSVEATPVIKPNPEPRPFKFLSIANESRTRIIEVGVRVDFIAGTLSEAAASDKNVVSMSLYDPHGSPFGRFAQKSVTFGEAPVNLPDRIPTVIRKDNSYLFYSKVRSSHPRCCQCDKAGTSKGGEYYYVLESEVSGVELATMQARIEILSLLMAIGNLLLSLVAARFISRTLVRNIEAAVSRVRSMKVSGGGERIRLDSNDEIGFLTDEFDNLLDHYEEAQRKVIEAEKIEAKVEIAKVVAHNIRSPIVAIEMMLPQMAEIPDRMRRTLQNSVKEIKQLSDRLRLQAESMFAAQAYSQELIFLPVLLEDVICQKQMEYSSRADIQVQLCSSMSKMAFVLANGTELKSILSNLINNSVESMGPGGGKVLVRADESEKQVGISVIDNGAGIPREFLSDLGRRKMSFKGESRGYGLVHAFRCVEFWGGGHTIESNLGIGTVISLTLPKYVASEKKSSGSQSTAR